MFRSIVEFTLDSLKFRRNRAYRKINKVPYWTPSTYSQYFHKDH